MRASFAIVGYGVVGRAMHRLLPESVIYDIAPGMDANRATVNRCDIAMVCVPTPAAPDGSCDISAVETSVAWIETPLVVIRSTVPPGTTRALAEKHGKRLVFQPEYLGETVAHPYANVASRGFIVLGGHREDTSEVADAYSAFYHSSVKFHFTDSTTAELAKYMENCFFAVKVTFCNEFRAMAESIGVSYPELREVWLSDDRISRDHTFAYPDKRVIDGRCLPKDLSAIIEFAKRNGHGPELLGFVQEMNRQRARRPEPAES